MHRLKNTRYSLFLSNFSSTALNKPSSVEMLKLKVLYLKPCSGCSPDMTITSLSTTNPVGLHDSGLEF